MVDDKMMDARDWIHKHPGTLAANMPPRKVRAHLRALETRGLIIYRDDMWWCQCRTCTERVDRFNSSAKTVPVSIRLVKGVVKSETQRKK